MGKKERKISYWKVLYEREQEILDLPGFIKQENNLCNSIDFLATILMKNQKKDLERNKAGYGRTASSLLQSIYAVEYYLSALYEEKNSILRITTMINL